MKHVVILQDKCDESEVYSDVSWNEVVSRKLKSKLKNVPVERTVLSKEGKGCLFFPNKDAQEKAKNVLQEEFKVTVDSKPRKSIMPKMKIMNVDTDVYQDKDVLRQEILQKNEEVNVLVEKGKTFEVVFIDAKRNSATLKCSPEIRQIINKASGRLFIDMQVHRARDHFHPMQCYACQCFGHKQGSPECTMSGSGKNVCLYCSSGDHQSRDCPFKKQPSRFSCSNCSQSSNPAHKANKCHTSNSLSCPFVIKETNALIRRTAGLSDEEVKKYIIK